MLLSMMSGKINSLKTKEEVIERAKSFLVIYLKDPEGDFEEIENLMGSEITPGFHKDSKVWYVFLTTGFYHLHVYLNEDGSLGTVEKSNGKFITRTPEPDIPKKHKSLPPLFSPSDFKEIVKLPHNQ